MNDQSIAQYLRAIGLLTLLLSGTAIILFFIESHEFWAIRSLVAAAICSLFLGFLTVVKKQDSVPLPVEILTQLESYSSSESQNKPPLNLVHWQDPHSQGWNTIVEELRTRQALAALEARIDEKLTQNKTSDDTAVLDSLAEGVGVTDLNGHFTFVNSAFEAILAIDSSKLLKASIEDVLPSEVSANTIDAISRAIPVTFESQTKTDEGTLYFRWSRRPRLNEHCEPNGHVWLIRDVSQQKLAEKMREEFVSMATHELRTPLANINAYAETLTMADDIDFEQQKEFYNIIQAEATRLARFVDELLEISRMEAGSMSINCRITELDRMLKEICDKIQPEMNRKALDFSIVIPPKLPQIEVDKDAITAALVNLLGNAVKYTPEGGNVCFTVVVEDNEIQFRVQDSGIGISEDELPHVFEKFFRSDDGRVRDINGSGLGLAFSHEVARLHQGRINVSSELNQGSTFSLVLPLKTGVEI
ncbi:ATP-binding protein [uncultured Rubinisphaera sp.]|uniref:sensor histidine kinase n=1 Tax=uncultured Rubinisphaera sp. TaxID=1678686 RepID=UPI0030DB7434